MKQMTLIPGLPNTRYTQAWLQSFEEVARNYADAAEKWAKDKSDAHYKALIFQRMCLDTMLGLEK